MNEVTPIPTKAALADLLSETCPCGAPKRKRQTFCRTHFYKLPAGARLALYDQMGSGYEEAYANALAGLGLQSPALQAMESEVAK